MSLNYLQTNTITGETLNFSDADPMSKSVGSAMFKRGMKKGDVCLYMTTDVTKVFVFTLGVWRCGGIMYSSYPEDTQDTILTRIQDSSVKWVLCDASAVSQVKEAISQVSWPVEILTLVDIEGCTNVREIFEDDGAGKFLQIIEIKINKLFISFFLNFNRMPRPCR
jgi:acyl-coenzyme A synthetase/AMP-(fatty) acid ligase